MASAPVAIEPKGHLRPDWDNYFLQLAQLASTRSTCLRRQVGAVLVSGRRVLATGYNGAPQGLPHCLEVGCLRDALGAKSGERHELCRAIHAEQNLILQAAAYGGGIQSATVYSTNQPCTLCTKLLLNLDINRIVFLAPYPDELALTLLKEAGFSSSSEGAWISWTRE